MIARVIVSGCGTGFRDASMSRREKKKAMLLVWRSGMIRHQ